MRVSRVTIVSSRRPRGRNLNDDLQWLGASLGLFGLRDRDRSCFRLFIALLKASQAGRGLSSDELAGELRLTRGTVVHHLNRLMEAGLVVASRQRYVLASRSIEGTLALVQEEIDSAFDELRKAAKEIDKRMEL